MANDLFEILMIIFCSILLCFYSVQIKNCSINAASIITFFWGFCIVGARLFLPDDLVWHGYGLYYIILILSFFDFAYMYGRNTVKYTIKGMVDFVPQNFHLTKSSWGFVKVLLLIGIIRSIYSFYNSGFGISDLLSLSSLANMNHLVALDRYAGYSSESIGISLTTFVMYVLPLCGGFVFCFSQNKKEKLYAVATMFPILFEAICNNGKAGVVASVILWFISYIGGYELLWGKSPKISIRSTIKFAMVGCTVVLFLLTTMFLRLGDIDFVTAAEIVLVKIFNYAFGHIHSFDFWLSEVFDEASYTFGVQTFIGFFNAIGVVVRKQGVYDFVDGVNSNVFTGFRGLIDDFGIVFSLCLIGLCGLVCGIAERNVVMSKKLPALSFWILMSIEFSLLYGFIISPWSYSSFILAFIVFGFFLYFCKQDERKIE